MMFIMVLLPEPLCPTIATNSPALDRQIHLRRRACTVTASVT